MFYNLKVIIGIMFHLGLPVKLRRPMKKKQPQPELNVQTSFSGSLTLNERLPEGNQTQNGASPKRTGRSISFTELVGLIIHKLNPLDNYAAGILLSFETVVSFASQDFKQSSPYA